MNVSQVLDRAADFIETNGLRTGGRGELRSTCAANAVGYVCEDFPLNCEAWNALLRALGAPPWHHEPIWTWNDTPGRTAVEVIAMLRAVAMTERAREARLLPVVREQVMA